MPLVNSLVCILKFLEIPNFKTFVSSSYVISRDQETKILPSMRRQIFKILVWGGLKVLHLLWAFIVMNFQFL